MAGTEPDPTRYLELLDEIQELIDNFDGEAVALLG